MTDTVSLKRAVPNAVITMSLVVGTAVALLGQGPLATIDFNPPNLKAIPPPFQKDAANTRANRYREEGMLFTDGVDPNPPEDGLNPTRYNHYHLTYEDPNVTTCAVGGFFMYPAKMTFDGCVAVVPEDEPRRLASMSPHHVIQMIYDPNNDGVADPFRLVSLEVYGGRLNVGTKSPTTGISVYNNLTAGFTWFLVDANNLTRATFEHPGDSDTPFFIDNIVFEPITGSPRTVAAINDTTTFEDVVVGTADSVLLPSVPPSMLEPIMRQLAGLVPLAFPSLDIQESELRFLDLARDRFKVRGRADLSSESIGVDMLNDDITVNFGQFRELIPGRLFRCTERVQRRACTFRGSFGGITRMSLVIAETTIEFRVDANGVNVSESVPAESTPFSLQIGRHLGVTHIGRHK